MSSYRPHEKRGRLKLSKNLGRLYRESKCRDCVVKITPMDFAKILGKFTKVKIQYETCGTRKDNTSDNENNNATLNNIENGMVLIHKHTYSSEKLSPHKDVTSADNASTQHIRNNILKENNIEKKTLLKNNFNNSKQMKQNSVKLMKQYGVTFIYPSIIKTELHNKVSLSELLPFIDNKVLPSEEWNIDFFPKSDISSEDKVYDRIAAELEDLMNNGRIITRTSKKDESSETKSEEFPSIMDILNDTSNKTSESTDVEAILLGSAVVKESITEPMEVDVSSKNKINIGLTENIGNPSSVDEELQKGVMIHIPERPEVVRSTSSVDEEPESFKADGQSYESTTKRTEDLHSWKNISDNKVRNTTHVVFKQMENGKCNRLVMCPKSLIYNIELEGKTVELRGAPKYISSLEDLKVLLEIVNETELNSFYVNTIT